MKLHFTFFRLIIIGCSLLTFPENSFIFSQEDEKFSYSLTYYDAKEGLPQNRVVDIVGAKTGILVYTTNGIVSFNGKGFESYISDKEYIKEDYNKIYTDTVHNVIYGQSLYDAYYQIYPSFERLKDYVVSSTHNDTTVGITRDGRIEAFIYDPAKTISSFNTGLSGIRDIGRSGNNFYIITLGGVYCYNSIKKSLELLDNSFCRLLVNVPNSKEIATVRYDGSILFLSDKQVRISKFSLPPTKGLTIQTIKYIDFNRFVIGTSAGIFIIEDEEHIVHYPITVNGRAMSIHSIYYLKDERILLLGSENRGLIKLIPKKFSTFYIPDSGLQSFGSTLRDKNNVIYAVSGKGIILKIENDSIIDIVDTQRPISTMNIINDSLFVSVLGRRLFKLNSEHLEEIIYFPQTENIFSYNAIYQDISGGIWAGGRNNLTLFNPKKGITKDFSSEIKHETIFTIGALQDNRLFIGGSTSVFIVDLQGNILESYSKEDGLDAKQVNAFYEDNERRIWIGTLGGGLYLLENRRITSINLKKNAFLDDNVYTLAKYGNRIFMSSNQGLYYVTETDVIDFYQGKIDYLVPGYLGEEVGINNTEFCGGFNTSYSIANNKIFFPTIYGLVKFSPLHKMYKSSQSPIVDITSILINDTLYQPVSDNKLNHSIRTITLNFRSISYSEEENLYYQCRLIKDNQHTPWEKLQKTEYETYKTLSHGSYEFQVRAITRGNDRQPRVTTFNFSVPPYFYETLWFRVSFILLIALLLFYIFYRRILYISKREKLNHALLELKINNIQSKLDPHFMFNTLHNIIYLLNDDRVDTAEELLQQFSQLLRSYFDKSNEPFITIQDELKILQLYIEIQQLRFENHFDYEITSEPSLNIVKLPVMLLQPFIENAIQHGLVHKKGKGHLKVQLFRCGSDLFIQIEDNGVGREATRRINKGRVSQGTKLIKNKIDLLRKKYGIEIDFEIIDLDNDGEKGTLVRFVIPMKGLKKLG